MHYKLKKEIELRSKVMVEDTFQECYNFLKIIKKNNREFDVFPLDEEEVYYDTNEIASLLNAINVSETTTSVTVIGEFDNQIIAVRLHKKSQKMNGELQYIKGDLFELLPYQSSSIKIVPHICNNLGIWGKGFVAPLGKKWPAAKESYKKWHNNGLDSFQLGEVQFVKVQDDQSNEQNLNGSGAILVANMIAQQGVRSKNNTTPIRYISLSQCIQTVRNQCVYMQKNIKFPVEIHAPKFGAGLAGGNWEFIETLICEGWVRKGIPVTIYEYA